MADERRAARIKKSKQPTAELAKFRVLRRTAEGDSLNFGRKNLYTAAETVLTDVSLGGVKIEGQDRLTVTGLPSDSLWFGDVASYIVTETGRWGREYRARIRIRNLPDVQSLSFATEAERDAFCDRFKTAVTAWWTEYGDALE